MFKSESIVLNKRPLGEADLLVTFFSLEHGKLKGVARHAKKSKKRFAGIFEAGYDLEIEYSTRSGTDLANIGGASLLAPTAHKALSLEHTYGLFLGLEMAERFLADADSNSQKFELLKRFCAAAYDGRMTRDVILFFISRWIGLCGYQIDHGKMKYEEALNSSFDYCKVLLGRPLRVEEYKEFLIGI